MNTAVATLDTPPAKKSNPLLEGFARLSNNQKLMLGAGLLAMLAVVAAALLFNRQADWKVLYSNLSDKDGGAVVAQLNQLGVPYQHLEGGGAIMVPADKIHDTRLRLASQGLPKGSTVGFELMDVTRLGMTQFQERLTFQRGLEGELVRSITALSSVADARVHLALPNQNGFFREQQKPSASVVLTLHGGRTLDKMQVAGIVHLVASSVPEMDTKAVSVLDQNGNLLSQSPDLQNGDIDGKQLEYTRKLEQMYTQRILDLLEPVVGRDNVKAQVTADVDFSITEQTSEQHRPNQNGEPSTVRSQQLVESGAAAAANALPGAPANMAAGAVANQPPGPGGAPINGEAAPVGINAGANNAGNGAAAAGGDNRRESVINYEVDKTIKVTRNSVGNVRRLSAAVVVNHRSVTDKKGNVTSEPLPPEQVEQMTALVREAIGFSADRGDSVNLMNASFTAPKVDETQVAWWQSPETQDWAKTLAWPLGMVLLGLIVFLGMVRPAIKVMQTPPPAPELPDATQMLEAVVDDDTERPALAAAKQDDGGLHLDTLRLEDAKRLAKENPVAVANIIKGWVNGDSPAMGGGGLKGPGA